MIEERVRCNECAVKDCNNYDKLNIAKRCPMFVELSDFKTPMLVHLTTEGKSENTVKVLEKFGFIIHETGRYPYFKLAIQ
jgi:hypothetical protein